jgi:hypothetical protein
MLRLAALILIAGAAGFAFGVRYQVSSEMPRERHALDACAYVYVLKHNFRESQSDREAQTAIDGAALACSPWNLQ